MNGPIKKLLTAVSTAMPLFLLLSTLFNVYLTSKLAPLASADALQLNQIQAQENQISDIQQTLKTHVTQTDLEFLVTRVNHISNRVDAIYSIVANRK